MQNRTKLSNFLYFFVTLAFFLFVNLHFSNLISTKLNSGWQFSNDFVNFVFVKNTGAAFSILQNSTLGLAIFSIFAVFAIIYYIIRNLDTILMKEIFPLSLLLSGILGNLFERLYFGYVRDYFDLAFVNFPVFNISDIFINLGVFVIIILVLLSKKPIKLL